MNLLDEIVDLAVDDGGSVSVLLRKCLVLAHQLKNDRLKAWAESELNGYPSGDGVPDYRKVVAGAKGFMVGPSGSQIRDQPLPSSVLLPEHAHFAEQVTLMQPIGSYEDSARKGLGKRRAIIEWPANLTAMYQTKFMPGYALNRAWQEIPDSVFPGLIDAIRTRVLQFALELRDELGAAPEGRHQVSNERVDKIFANFIFGGTNVIAGVAQDLNQISSISVPVGDMGGLTKALKILGADTGDLATLEAALAEDAATISAPGLGQRAATWLKDFGRKAASTATGVGLEVVKAAAVKAVMQYLGLG